MEVTLFRQVAAIFRKDVKMPHALSGSICAVMPSSIALFLGVDSSLGK
jgi:hypothetical protein